MIAVLAAGKKLAGPLAWVLVAISAPLAADDAATASNLRSPDAFTDIADEQERSVALFEEAGKVIEHPRCVNCHPAGDSPLQGEDGRLHEPPVVRGAQNRGAPGMHCTTCHGARNYEPAGVPGDPEWHVAPVEMSWTDKTLGKICEQIKDPARNGGKSMEEIVEHMAHDHLVGWGWSPGGDREPVPGTQVIFGELIAAWMQTGAACPQS